MIYDSIIIGRGLIGSAAAKYISRSQKKIAIIGPDEETAFKEGIVFASHYDQARIQSIVGKIAVYTLLNQQAANEYPSLENESNIHFHSKEGCLTVTPAATESYLNDFSEQAKRFSANYEVFDNRESLHSFNSNFVFPHSATGFFEPPPSGTINPGLLIKAQLEVFKKNEGEIFNNIANGISCEKEVIKISCIDNKIFYAKKVLLAPGAFANFLNLLKKKLFLKVKSETTIWVKVKAEEAERLSSLPPLLYKIDNPQIQDVYLIRPIKYPDGNFYLKIGANIPSDFYFKDLEEIQNWFTKGNNIDNTPVLLSALKSILPELSIEECHEKRCIVTYTKHGKPYIGPVENKGLYIATGGNGYGAMCSDALGKIAATVLLEAKFPASFSEQDFVPVFDDKGLV